MDFGDAAATRTVTEGIAVLAVMAAEAGSPPDEISSLVRKEMLRYGLTRASDALAIADAITGLPPSMDFPPDELESRRPIYAALGLRMPEEEIASTLRARDAVASIARMLP